MKIPFHKPTVSQAEEQAILEVLRSGWLTTGEHVRKFEREFAKFTNCKFAVAVNSCTAAMHIALVAKGIQKDDEVITTPYTFIATVEAIEYVGATPVLVDVGNDANISPKAIEQAISPKTRAIIPVHIAGNPCEMGKIREIADKNNLFILQDAAHALETKIGEKHIAEFGDATAFSFYATKNITTAGEGGMLVTNYENLAKTARQISLHGMSKDAHKRYESGGKWFYEITDLGFKYNMSDVSAAMGRVQLQNVEKWHKRRCEIVGKYNCAFSKIAGLKTPFQRENTQNAWHLYILRLDEKTAISRDKFIEELNDLGVGTSVHFIPVHFHPFYKNRVKYTDLSNAELLFKNAISLPLFPTMTDAEIEFIIEQVCRFFL